MESVRQSRVKYIRNYYPFLEMQRPMLRWQVVQWLQENRLEVPVRPGCVFCPFHRREILHEMSLSGNGDWEKAVGVDAAIRHQRPGFLLYLNSKRVPLAELDLRSDEERGQLRLWSSDECSGFCFL